jgi:hypothetical protein
MLCDYLFAHTTVQRIQAGTHPENIAEQKALEKVGRGQRAATRRVHARGRGGTGHPMRWRASARDRLGLAARPWDDSLMFIFDGGVLTGDDQARITLRDGELAAYRFSEPKVAARLLRPYVWRRAEKALAALPDGAMCHLHDGQPI